MLHFRRGLGGEVVLLAALLLGCVQDVELVRLEDSAVMPPPSWERVTSSVGVDLHDLHGSAPNDLWTVGDNGTALHWDGTQWRPTATNTTARLTGVWSGAPNDAWAVGADPFGEEVALHWNGTQWMDVRIPNRDRLVLRAVWGARADDVYAVGGLTDSPEPALWHWNGSMWRPELSFPGGRPWTLSAVEGNASGELWVAGAGLQLQRHSNTGWSNPPPPPAGTILGGAMCLGASGDVWLSGSGSALLHLAGTTWSSVPLPQGASLRGLHCAPNGAVFGVGPMGFAGRVEANQWRTERTPGMHLEAVFSADARTLWAVGPQGTIVRRSAP